MILVPWSPWWWDCGSLCF